MERDTITLKEFLTVLRRRRWTVLTTAFVMFVITVAVAFKIPSVYRSTATLIIENQEIPENLVPSTVTTDADRRIQVISQRVMTSANLFEIVRKYNLYSKIEDQEPSQTTLARMRNDIQLEMINVDVVDPRRGRSSQATIAFTISYESSSPHLAQQVTMEIASLYLDENARIRRELTSETSNFLANHAAKIKHEVSALERELAHFKEKNADQLPEFMGLYLQLIDQVERDIADVERQIRSAEQNEIFLRSQLAQLSPRSVVMMSKGERLLSPNERLAVLESQYLSLSARYAADHPDLVRIRKEIAALRAELPTTADDSNNLQRRQGTDAKSEHVTADPAVGSVDNQLVDNPAYLEVEARLKMAASELRALRDKQQNLSEKLVAYKDRLTHMPQVEREYRNLSREYENALRKYEDVKGKEMKAQLAESLETERKAERFTLIEPPQLPIAPVSPKRSLIVLLGLALSFAGGIGAAAVAEAMDQSVRGVETTARLTGQRPFAVIPYVETPVEKSLKAVRRLVFAVLVISGLFVGVAVYSGQMLSIDEVWLSLQSILRN